MSSDRMENLPEALLERLQAGEKPKDIARDVKREVQEYLEQVDEQCQATVEKRKTYPSLINDRMIEEKKNRLKRLVNAPVSEYALDTPIEVNKLVKEVNTLRDVTEDLKENNEALRERLADMKKRHEELKDYRLALFETVMDSSYSPIHCFNGKANDLQI